MVLKEMDSNSGLRSAPQVSQHDINLFRRPDAYTLQKAEGFRARPHPEPWPLQLPLDWSADPFKSRNWCFQLHAWRMTDPILQQYFETDHNSCLREAFEFALDWHRFHFLAKREAKLSWNDMATGIRAMRIALFLDRVHSDALDLAASELCALYELADEHVRRMKEPGYISLTNHGIFQIFGLNLLCRVEPEREAMQGGRDLAAEMLDKLVNSQFTEEGIHTEHSPYYHRFGVRALERLGVKRHFQSGAAVERVAKARRLCGWMVFPDGAFARIGDSFGVDAPLEEAPTTTLADGREFWVGDFTRSGYVIIREARRNGQSMLFVTGMANSTTHKHADELSFELLERGRYLFVDTGKYGYETDQRRRYALSAAAHNTISVEEQQIRGLFVKKKGSALASLECDGGSFRISGAVERPGIFRQRRHIIYDPGQLLVISDTLEANQPWTYHSNLHLAQDLQPAVTARGFSIDLGEGGLIGAMMVSPNSTISAARGQEQPMLGWATCAYGELEPTTTISAECPGMNRTVTWAIWFDEEWRDEALALARRLDRRPQEAFGPR